MTVYQSELRNIIVFFECLAKAASYTGLGPGILALIGWPYAIQASKRFKGWGERTARLRQSRSTSRSISGRAVRAGARPVTCPARRHSNG